MALTDMGKRQGLTIIELVIVISILAIIIGITTIASNPVQQFANARNTQRWSHVNSLINAISQNIADNNNVFTCTAGSIPTTKTVLGTSGYNISSCITPTYIVTLPFDPKTGTTTDIGYSILQSATSGVITVYSDDAELGIAISAAR